MCVAVLKPKNIKISDETLKKCWDANKDGGGFMYSYNDKLIIRKELKSFEKYIKLYRKHEKKINTDFVLHFRIATSGLIDLNNTHPHKVNEDTYLVHNGVIDRCSDANSKTSDTMKFCKFISNLPSNFIHNKSMMELISGYIGTDKMIFLNKHGEIKIVNEKRGAWIDGCWFSNENWNYTKKLDSWTNRYWDNWEDTTYTKKHDNECSDCDVEIGKYESNDYDGKCYSCWNLMTETNRYYGDF